MPAPKKQTTSQAGFKKAATTAKPTKPGFQVTHGGKTLKRHRQELGADARRRVQTGARRDAMLVRDATARTAAAKKATDKKIIGAAAGAMARMRAHKARTRAADAKRQQVAQARAQSARQFISGIVSKPVASRTYRRTYKKTVKTTRG